MTLSARLKSRNAAVRVQAKREAEMIARLRAEVKSGELWWLDKAA